MIRVLIPQNKDFELYKDECKALYESVQDKIHDPNSFEFITNNTFFYLFENDGVLIGGIYLFEDDNKLWLNGFAKRKMHKLCLECLYSSISWFDCDIYAEAQNRASALSLLRAGFKRLEDNIFVKYLNKNL